MIGIKTFQDIRRKVLRVIRGKNRAPRVPKPYTPMRRSLQEWEARYASGELERYGALYQLSRYSLIAGYCRYFKQAPAILDVGCGQGFLQQRLDGKYEKYVGIDVSAEAITQAAVRQDEKTAFIAADGALYASAQRFDIIIFNDCLICFERPLDIMRKYEDFIKADGIFIVSMYEKTKSSKGKLIWEMLKDRYAPLDAVRVTQEDTQVTWVIKVFTPSNTTPI